MSNPSTISFDPEGGPLSVKLQFNGLLVAGYELSAIQGDDITPYFSQTGSNAESSEIDVALPGTAAEHQGAVLMLTIKLEPLDRSAASKYEAGFSLQQDGQDCGGDSAFGEFGDSIVSVDLVGLMEPQYA